QEHGLIERRARPRGGYEYWLTPAGEALRPLVNLLGLWGLKHSRDWLTSDDLDPTLLMWALRKRVDHDALPDHRIVVRFEFAGVPASRTKFRILWLILARSEIDICVKDPGFTVDLVFRGNVRDFIALYLGHREWHEVVGKDLIVEGDRRHAKRLAAWLRLDKVIGRDLPLLPSAA